MHFCMYNALVSVPGLGVSSNVTCVFTEKVGSRGSPGGGGQMPPFSPPKCNPAE